MRYLFRAVKEIVFRSFFFTFSDPAKNHISLISFTISPRSSFGPFFFAKNAFRSFFTIAPRRCWPLFSARSAERNFFDPLSSAWSAEKRFFCSFLAISLRFLPFSFYGFWQLHFLAFFFMVLVKRTFFSQPCLLHAHFPAAFQPILFANTLPIHLPSVLSSAHCVAFRRIVLRCRAFRAAVDLWNTIPPPHSTNSLPKCPTHSLLPIHRPACCRCAVSRWAAVDFWDTISPPHLGGTPAAFGGGALFSSRGS